MFLIAARFNGELSGSGAGREGYSTRDPKYATAYQNRGIARSHAGDFVKAIADLEEAIRLEPRPVWLVYHNPLLEHVLAERGVFRKTVGTMQWAVFTNRPSAAQPEDASRKI